MLSSFFQISDKNEVIEGVLVCGDQIVIVWLGTSYIGDSPFVYTQSRYNFIFWLTNNLVGFVILTLSCSSFLNSCHHFLTTREKIQLRAERLKVRVDVTT